MCAKMAACIVCVWLCVLLRMSCFVPCVECAYRIEVSLFFVCLFVLADYRSSMVACNWGALMYRTL